VRVERERNRPDAGGFIAMSNHFTNLTAAAGAAVLALALTGAFAVRADTQSAASQQVPQAETVAQMQARMQTMHAQMAQLQTVTDPAERQRLLSAHMALMQEQMASMRNMGGGMMQMMHGGAAMGMGMHQGADTGEHSPGPRHQMMEDRLDMLQMMMEQLMGQMQMQSGPHGPGR
jgi:hypothetical protein